MDIMQQSACLVGNPIAVYSYDFLFNCTSTVDQASDSMTAMMLSLVGWLVPHAFLWLGPPFLNVTLSLTRTI